MKKKLLFLLEIILIGLICFSGFKIFDYYSSLYRAKEEFDKIENIAEQVRKDERTDVVKEKSIGEVEVKTAKKLLEELKKENEDIVAYIEIPDLDLSYPVVHVEDNNYYLRRNLKGEYSVAGTLFIDYKNNGKFSDQNTVIYGHRMRNKSMFGTLENYFEQDFVDKADRLIRITTEEGVFVYKIYACFRIDETYDYRSPNYGDAWLSFLKETATKSIATYPKDELDSLNQKTRILTLSTCDRDYEHDRVAVQARMVNSKSNEALGENKEQN